MGSVLKDDREYFCHSCGQFRLAFSGVRLPLRCGACGSGDLLEGEVGELDRDALKAAWKQKNGARAAEIDEDS